jgi:PilZ domain
MGWTVRRGHLVLIEPEGADSDACVTGLVEAIPDDENVVVDLGSSPRLGPLPCPVQVSLYTPEAFYHAAAEASANGSDDRVINLRMTEIESIPRRAARLAAAIPIGLAGFDHLGSFVAAAGETIDLSAGGCRVRVDAPLPSHGPAALMVPIDDGVPIVALAAIKEETPRRRGWEYRLSFLRISEDDAERLTALV